MVSYVQSLLANFVSAYYRITTCPPQKKKQQQKKKNQLLLVSSTSPNYPFHVATSADDQLIQGTKPPTQQESHQIRFIYFRLIMITSWRSNRESAIAVITGTK